MKNKRKIAIVGDVITSKVNTSDRMVVNGGDENTVCVYDGNHRVHYFKHGMYVIREFNEEIEEVEEVMSSAEIKAHELGFHIGDKVDWTASNSKNGLIIESFHDAGGVCAKMERSGEFSASSYTSCSLRHLRHSGLSIEVTIGDSKAIVTDNDVSINGESISLIRAILLMHHLHKMNEVTLIDSEVMLKLFFKNNDRGDRIISMNENNLSIGCAKDVSWGQVEKLEVAIKKMME